MSLFITGTDTDIGKTVASALLSLILQSMKKEFKYFKPVQTGTDLDCETVAKLSGLDSKYIIQPVYYFKEPISPNRAAHLNSNRIEIDPIVAKFKALGPAIVEGAGGILVPLNDHQSMIDLVQALQIKTLVVTSTRLGTLNHTRLTIEALKNKGLPILGIVLMGEEDKGLVENLEHFTGVEVLAELPKLKSLDLENLNEFAKSIACDKIRAKLEDIL